ncbi:MAG: hypothetical protein ABSH36_15185 [Solirubrobacteraceae bacterium]
MVGPFERHPTFLQFFLDPHHTHRHTDHPRVELGEDGSLPGMASPISGRWLVLEHLGVEVALLLRISPGDVRISTEVLPGRPD